MHDKQYNGNNGWNINKQTNHYNDHRGQHCKIHSTLYNIYRMYLT